MFERLTKFVQRWLPKFGGGGRPGPGPRPQPGPRPEPPRPEPPRPQPPRPQPPRPEPPRPEPPRPEPPRPQPPRPQPPRPGPGHHWPDPVHGEPGHGVWGRPWGWGGFWRMPVLLDDGRYAFSGANAGDPSDLEPLIQQLAEFYGLSVESLTDGIAADGQTVVYYTVWGWDANIEQFIEQLDAEAPGTAYAVI